MAQERTCRSALRLRVSLDRDWANSEQHSVVRTSTRSIISQLNVKQKIDAERRDATVNAVCDDGNGGPHPDCK